MSTWSKTFKALQNNENLVIKALFPLRDFDFDIPNKFFFSVQFYSATEALVYVSFHTVITCVNSV